MELRNLDHSTAMTATGLRLQGEDHWHACHTVKAVDPERSWSLNGFRPHRARPPVRRTLADLLLRAAEVLARSDPSGSPV